jgi:hypothetical protein
VQRHQQLDHRTPIGIRPVGARLTRAAVNEWVEAEGPSLRDDLVNVSFGGRYRCNDEAQPFIAPDTCAAQRGRQQARLQDLQQSFLRHLRAESRSNNTLRLVSPPTLKMKPVPVISDDELAALPKACNGREFADRRLTDYKAGSA